MRSAFLIACVALLGGCTEVVQLGEARFYVRHWSPLGGDSAGGLAAARCAAAGKSAELVADERYLPLDLSYATYRCR